MHVLSLPTCDLSTLAWTANFRFITLISTGVKYFAEILTLYKKSLRLNKEMDVIFLLLLENLKPARQITSHVQHAKYYFLIRILIVRPAIK